MADEETKVSLARVEEQVIAIRKMLEAQQHERRITSLEHSRTKLMSGIATAWAGVIGLAWLLWRI